MSVQEKQAQKIIVQSSEVFTPRGMKTNRYNVCVLFHKSKVYLQQNCLLSVRDKCEPKRNTVNLKSCPYFFPQHCMPSGFVCLFIVYYYSGSLFQKIKTYFFLTSFQDGFPEEERRRREEGRQQGR